MYASGWVMASVRIFCSVARLAVMIASAPEPNWIQGGEEAYACHDDQSGRDLALLAEKFALLYQGLRHRVLDMHAPARLDQVLGHAEVRLGGHGHDQQVGPAGQLPVVRQRQ